MAGPNRANLFAKARFYDPKTARFTTADSFLGQPDQPPSLHRYTYVRNNPARYVDPSGHSDEDANALAAAMSSRIGFLASDHRPAYEKSWWRNFSEELSYQIPTRALPSMQMFEGLAKQDGKEFAAGAAGTALAGAAPVVVKEAGGALLSQFPKLAQRLATDLGELGSKLLGKGQEALSAAASRLRNAFGSGATTTLESAVGAQAPMAPAVAETVPGLNRGPFPGLEGVPPGTRGGTLPVRGGSQAADVAAPSKTVATGLSDASTSPWLADPRAGVVSHLERFREGGSFLVAESSFQRFIAGKKRIGDPSGQFLAPRATMDHLLADAGGDIGVLKERLGIPKEAWNEPLRRIDINNPLLHNARLPSGLERGANRFFQWGGYTSGGIPEIVVDPAPARGVTISAPLFGTAK